MSASGASPAAHAPGEASKPRAGSSPATQTTATSSADVAIKRPSTCAPRCIPIYVRVVQKDIWLRIHVDMRSTIGAVKDAILIKAGFPDYDPSMQPFFYEDASRASSDAKVSIGPGEGGSRATLTALPKAFMARRPRQDGSTDNFLTGTSRGLRAKGFSRGAHLSSHQAPSALEEGDSSILSSSPTGQLPRLARARASFSSLTTAASKAAQLSVGHGSKDSTTDFISPHHLGELPPPRSILSRSTDSSGLGTLEISPTAMSGDSTLDSRIGTLLGNEEAKRVEREALARAQVAMARWPPAAAGQGSTSPSSPPPITRNVSYSLVNDGESSSLASRHNNDSFTSVSSLNRASVDAAMQSSSNVPSSPSSLRPGSSARRAGQRRRYGAPGFNSAGSWNDDDSDDLDLLGLDTSDGDSSHFSGFDSMSDMGHALSARRLSRDGNTSSQNLTTADSSRLWGTQLEEALALEHALKRRPKIEVDMDDLGLTIGDDSPQPEEILQSPEGADLLPPLVNRRRSGTVTNASKGAMAMSTALGLAVDETDEENPTIDTLDGASFALPGSRDPHSRSTTHTTSDSLASDALVSSGDSRQTGALSSSSQPSIESDDADGTGSSKLSADYMDVAEYVPTENKPLGNGKQRALALDPPSSPNTRRIGGINQDEISVWRSAQHPLSSLYCVYSFSSGHLLEDWRTVASFRVRPFELFEVQHASISDRIHLPRGRPGVAPPPTFLDPRRGGLHQDGAASPEVTVPRVANTLHQKPAALSVDERYAESYFEGWFYVHKMGSGPSKLLKAGLGVWKLRWIVVRGWRLTVYRKRPRRVADAASSTSITLAWHLGTISSISEEGAEGRTNPPLPPNELLAPQMLVVSFSTAASAPLSTPSPGGAAGPTFSPSVSWAAPGGMTASVSTGGGASEKEREREATGSSAGGGPSSSGGGFNTIAIRCITSFDHTALHRLLTRAHYRYALGRVDAAHGVEVETWRRTAILRATIAGRGGVVQPGRHGRKGGRNALARTRLRPAGISREWDDADSWSDHEEEEQILPRGLREPQ